MTRIFSAPSCGLASSPVGDQADETAVGSAAGTPHGQGGLIAAVVHAFESGQPFFVSPEDPPVSGWATIKGREFELISDQDGQVHAGRKSENGRGFVVTDLEGRVQMRCFAADGGRWYRGAPLVGASLSVARIGDALTAVVVWPHLGRSVDREDGTALAEFVAEQGDYGHYFADACRDIGARIGRGELPTFDAAWDAATSIRANAPGGAHHGVGVLRNGDSEAQSMRTPLGGRYLYVAQRVLSHPDATLEEGIFPDRPFLWLGDERGGTSLRVQIAIRDETVQIIPSNTYTESLLGSAMMHPDPPRVLEMLREIAVCFDEALKAIEPGAFDQAAARFYWLAAHAAPDVRCSAAKVELIYRALHVARGFGPPPPWRPGKSADIEAILRSQEAWLRDYRGLQADNQSWLDEYQRDFGDTGGLGEAARAPVDQPGRGRLQTLSEAVASGDHATALSLLESIPEVPRSAAARWAICCNRDAEMAHIEPLIAPALRGASEAEIEQLVDRVNTPAFREGVARWRQSAESTPPLATSPGSTQDGEG